MRDLLRYTGHVSHTNFLGEAAVVVLCVLLAVGGRSGVAWDVGEWSLLEVEVPPLKDESLVKDMAIIEELSQQICWSSIFFFFEIFWASYFDWHGKKPPKPKPNHPKLDWNQPPKIHPQKSNQPYPQTEATFPSISSLFCQVDSVVPMDEPLFKATPSEIRFANFASRAECRHSRWGREFPGWGGDWAVGWLVDLLFFLFDLLFF